VLVFGRLSANGRRLAQEAGDEFARKQVGPQTPASVARIDGGLIPLLDRSADPVAVKEGVRKATGAVAGAQGIASNTLGVDSSYAGQQLGRFSGGASSRDLSQSESLAFLGSLVSVVDALARDPGRKSVVVFSEGFAVPVGYEHVFADLKSRANRSNVSFYCLDVRGLQLQSQLGASGSALASATALSESQRQAGSETPATREQMTQDDAMQASMRADVVDTLAELATSTGGFLVTQTNDFGRPLARIGEDLHGYYEASYTPSTPAAPGQFRRIEVRLARKDVRLQTRSGYYTTPPAPAASSPAVAFAAFAKRELPNDLAIHRAFYRFGREKKGSPFDCLIKVEASLEKAEFRPGTAPGRLAGKIAFAGRVLGATGDVVETFGQDVALGGSEEQIRDARSRTLPLARRLKLAPGNYTVELIVRDAVGDRATAERFALTVPEPQGALSMTSLVVVAALEPADPKSDPTDPLRLGDKRIVPNLGQPVAASAGASLPIYYVVFVKPGAKLGPKATVEVARGAQVVARGSSPLPAADANGRITGLSPIPLQKLTPGSYTVKVSVTDGETTAEETATVTIGS
jgi:VWFA-related protein